MGDMDVDTPEEMNRMIIETIQSQINGLELRDFHNITEEELNYIKDQIQEARISQEDKMRFISIIENIRSERLRGQPMDVDDIMSPEKIKPIFQNIKNLLVSPDFPGITNIREPLERLLYQVHLIIDATSEVVSSFYNIIKI